MANRKVLVIDDCWGIVKTTIEKWSTGDVDVECVARIPDDLSCLSEYDALIVDGDGIGNGKFENGLEFLMSYDKPDGQAVVYHSGHGAYGDDKKNLEKRGVAVVTKGSNPEKLILAMRFAMEKTKGE